MSDANNMHHIVKSKYAKAATSEQRRCEEVFGFSLYRSEELEGIPTSAVEASLGCGVPTAIADLRPGEAVLDLGSGAGTDLLIAARRVGPEGKAIGIDITPEMVDLARANAAAAGLTNVEFLEGALEKMPLPDGSVDVVISNCVINLASDKRLVLQEAARVLRPGGRFAISDVVTDRVLNENERQAFMASTGCLAGALTKDEYRKLLLFARFTDISIIETHRVHLYGAAVIIKAVKQANAQNFERSLGADDSL